MKLEVFITIMDETGTERPTTFAVEVPPRSIVRAYEIRADGDPIIRAAFYHHGAGYHTICRRYEDETDVIES